MAAELKINLRKLREKKQSNLRERLKFIDFWVDYIRKTPDDVWSRQQKELIDAQIKIESIPSDRNKHPRK